MFQFAQPILLWSAAGIIVPIIIHLWNVKQGKTLKVGSIAFLTESAKSHAKSFKLSDLLLLLLRCLLIIVLAMLISKPMYQKELNQKENGWVLIEKNQVHEVYKRFQSKIDSLTNAGYTFHYLNTNFTEAKLEEILKTPQDTVKEPEFSYWGLLKELDEKVPSKLPVYLFTDNSLRRFTGTRPNISLNLKWNIYPSDDTLSKWIQKAYRTSNDSIRLIIGNSSPTGTSYIYQNVSAKPSNNKFAVANNDGKMFVSYKDTTRTTSNKPIEVDTATLVITIYSDKYNLDASYLKAAIHAIRDFTKYKMKFTTVNNVRSIPANCDWLFWLSEENIPASLNRNNVFVYEKGKVQNVRSSVVFKDRAEATMIEGVPLFKIIQPISTRLASTDAIWKDGFGNPLLALEKKDASVYHFYSRFNPQWSDLTWSAQFPQMIFDLLFQTNKNLNQVDEADKRIIDVTQIQPAIFAEETVVPKQNLVDRKDLSRFFWLLALILFVVERIVSSKAKKEEVYG